MVQFDAWKETSRERYSVESWRWEKIRLKNDRWIQNYSLLKPTVSLQDDIAVNFLIDEEIKNWNEAIIRTCLSNEDTEKILQIPLSSTSCDDFPAWPLSK
jgi:hypothetical protein